MIPTNVIIINLHDTHQRFTMYVDQDPCLLNHLLVLSPQQQVFSNREDSVATAVNLRHKYLICIYCIWLCDAGRKTTIDRNYHYLTAMVIG